MKRAILIHGCCSKKEFDEVKYPSNSHWFPWLKKQLVELGFETHTPDMPTPFSPLYEDWKAVFSRFIIDEETILVGHSCASGFILRWLADTKVKVKKIILVAPWLDPIKKRKGFLDFNLDPTIAANVKKIYVLYSSDDPVKGVKESVEQIISVYPQAKLVKFKDKGHFDYGSMETEEFPELCNLVIE
jgi:predicted alpha/beta hydrolase family esterase